MTRIDNTLCFRTILLFLAVAWQWPTCSLDSMSTADMWGTLKLNDGQTIPGIAFGSAQRRSPGAEAKSTGHILAALKAGFRHLDTAQQYGNEAEVGEAIRLSGIPREDIFITTKWSDGSMTARTACEASLEALGVQQIDLYVIHHTWTCLGDVPGAWRQMEELLEAGLVKSIGLSAFGLEEVEEVLASCQVKPAVNMIMLHPGVYAETKPLLDLMRKNHIVPGGYSSLKPLWAEDVPATVKQRAGELARKHGCTSERVLMEWCAAQGAVIYTSTTSESRMKEYLSGSRVSLAAAEVSALSGDS